MTTMALNSLYNSGYRIASDKPQDDTGAPTVPAVSLGFRV